MTEPYNQRETRRDFLQRIGEGAAAGALSSALMAGAPVGGAEQQPNGGAVPRAVKRRTLGKTGLQVSEIGFGGHSWAYARVPDGTGGMRKTSLDEATRMISIGLDMGVNLFDSCTPLEEHSTPGQVIKRLKARDRVVISARLCHKMKGVAADRPIISQWVDERLMLWQTDHFDILMLTNETNDTPESGYWDMSYCLEEVELLKKKGKIRFAGFGCHFEPHHYLDAFQRYGRAFDICSMPYNIRHRAAETIMPEAKRVGLGMITIKPFARGALLEGHDLTGTGFGVSP